MAPALRAGLLFALAATGLGGLVWTFDRAAREPQAEFEAMRRYAVARTSDEDLRRLQREAEEEYRLDRARALEHAQRERMERIEALRRCDDAAFRERSPQACLATFADFRESEPLIANVESRFYLKLLGVCLLGVTVGEARRAGCLAP